MPRKAKQTPAPAPRVQSYETKTDDRTAITPVEYGGLQTAFDHFNAALFGGTLSDVFITYQRKANSFGYFAADRFAFRDGKSGRKSELSLNPDAFINQPKDEQPCQTLVHEMVHLWQHMHGKPGARGYHNKEWAAKMKAIGLQPSNNGMVGGKETGQHMMDYIIPDAAFAMAFARLAATGWKLNLQSAHRAGSTKVPSSKTKFTCSSCDQNAWGKPDLEITCTPCGLEMQAERSGADVAVVTSYEPTVPVVEALPTYESTPEPEPMKSKRGRPKGSKNKPKALARSYDEKLPRKHKRKPTACDEAMRERAA